MWESEPAFTDLMTPLRIDLAVGNEGWRLVFSGGPIF